LISVLQYSGNVQQVSALCHSVSKTKNRIAWRNFGDVALGNPAILVTGPVTFRPFLTGGLALTGKFPHYNNTELSIQRSDRQL